jgi:outer membrane protein OmpA-like peptidoglycan-associated protein
MYQLLLSVPVLLGLAGPQTPKPPADIPNFIVFFNEDSAVLPPSAESIVEQAAGRARAQPKSVVHVLGFAPPTAGTADFDLALSRTRALAVADELAEAGISRDRIRVEPRGAVSYASTETESRRADIVISN